MEDKQVPLGVKIITVFLYLFGVLLTLSGFFGAFIGNFVNGPPGVDSLGFYLMILLIVIGVLCFFVGRNLGKGKRWARIVAIIISIPGFILSIMDLAINFQLDITSLNSLFPTLLFPIPSAVAFFYLLLNKKAKEFFQNN